MIEINGQRFYTPQEVADKFGVSIGTIARWRQDGIIHANRLSDRKYVFSEEAILNFVRGK